MASEGNWDALASNAAKKIGATDPGKEDSGVESFFGNSTIQQAMAQLGAGLDPKGVAGALGGAASRTIEAKGNREQMREMIKALGTGGKLKMTPDGSVELQAGKPQPEAESQGPEKSALAEGEQNTTSMGRLQDMSNKIYKQLFGGD